MPARYAARAVQDDGALKRHQRLGGAHRRRRIRSRAARRGHDRQRPGRGAARAARPGTALRVCAAGDTAVGDHRREHVSRRRAERRSVDQECRRRNASRQEGRPRPIGIFQEIDQYARRQAPVHGGRFAQGLGAQRIHPELSAPPGSRGDARGSRRGFAALVAPATRLCLARRVHPPGGAERPDR